MRAIVTGGAGFIGSHLVDRLLKDGHDVVVIDNFTTGRRANLQDHPKLEVHEVDLADAAVVAPLFAGANWVFHVAGRSDIADSVRHPSDFFHVDLDGTVSALEACRANGVQRFVYAASASCYGVPDQLPTTESAALGPRLPGGVSRMQGEQVVMHWASLYDMAVVSLRLFNVFGPRGIAQSPYGNVVGLFLAQARAGLPLTVTGDGTQTRDFTYVEDIADAFVRAAASNVRGEIFNVGSGHTYPINLLADLVGGNRVKIPQRPEEPECTFADVQKIETMLGWHPTTPFEEAVVAMAGKQDDWSGLPAWSAAEIAQPTR